jgi:hypothetical protein
MNSLFDSIQQLQRGELMFPAFELAFKQMKANLDLYRGTGVAQNLLVLGESGTGKTTLARMFTRCYPKQVLLEGDVVPVLYVPVPPAATIAGTVECVLAQLGDVEPQRGTVSAKTARAAKLARGCKVEMLLFDEAQHIQDRGRSNTQYFVGDWLKSFMDALDLPVTMLGLPRTEGLLRVNEQLRRRFTRRMSMAVLQPDGMNAGENSLQLLVDLAACLTLPINPHPMDWRELGFRVQFATDNRIAYIKQLLVCAYQRAVTLGEKEITIQDMAYAFTNAIWPAGIGAFNPFEPEFLMRRLDGLNEPFQAGDLGASIAVRARK